MLKDKVWIKKCISFKVCYSLMGKYEVKSVLFLWFVSLVVKIWICKYLFIMSDEIRWFV